MNSPFSKAAGAPKVDLDSAEAYDPELEDGSGVVEIVQCETYEGTSGLAFSASVKIVDFDNSQASPEAMRKIRIAGLNAPDQAGGKAKRLRLREFLAACLGVSPQLESPDGEHTWSDLLNEVVAGEGTALAGRQITVSRKTVASKKPDGRPWALYQFKAL